MKRIEGNLKNEVKYFTGYLRKKGIPAQMIEAIRISFIQEALDESLNLKFDRIYACTGLMLHNMADRLRESLNEKGEIDSNDILVCLQEFNRIMVSAGEDEKSWEEIMAELDDKTGIVVHSEGDNRVILEYEGLTSERAEEIRDAENRSC